MINDYIIVDHLGQGGFGTVKLAIKNENKYALKIFKKSHLKRKREYIKDKETGKTKVKDALEDVRREIAIMKKISHPNLIQLYEVIDNPSNEKIIMGKIFFLNIDFIKVL